MWALERGNLALAKEQAEGALRIEASSAEKYGGSHLGRILLGLVGLWEKTWTAAERCFQEVLTRSPNDFAARNNIALALVEQDDAAKKQRALECAEANMRDGSRNPDVLLHWAGSVSAAANWTMRRRPSIMPPGYWAASSTLTRRPTWPISATTADEAERRRTFWRKS